jgi:hypothetical protein
MKLRSIGKYIADEVRHYAYPPLFKVAEKAVEEVQDIASIGSRSQLKDWAARKFDAVKRHFLIYSEVEKMVHDAKFHNIEEARTAVKALKGCLEKRKDNYPMQELKLKVERLPKKLQILFGY